MSRSQWSLKLPISRNSSPLIKVSLGIQSLFTTTQMPPAMRHIFQALVLSLPCSTFKCFNTRKCRIIAATLSTDHAESSHFTLLPDRQPFCRFLLQTALISYSDKQVA